MPRAGVRARRRSQDPGSEGCCAHRRRAMGGAWPRQTPSSAGSDGEAQLPGAGRCQRCPHFAERHRRGSVPASASPAAPVRRHAQSPWRLAPLILLKNDAYFWAGPRGDAGDPRAFASVPRPPLPWVRPHGGAAGAALGPGLPTQQAPGDSASLLIYPVTNEPRCAAAGLSGQARGQEPPTAAPSPKPPPAHPKAPSRARGRSRPELSMPKTPTTPTTPRRCPG